MEVIKNPPTAHAVIRKLVNSQVSAMFTSYAMDLSDDQWELIMPLLSPSKSSSLFCEVNCWAILNAIFYITVAGCVWHLLPHDFSKWKILTRTINKEFDSLGYFIFNKVYRRIEEFFRRDWGKKRIHSSWRCLKSNLNLTRITTTLIISSNSMLSTLILLRKRIS